MSLVNEAVSHLEEVAASLHDEKSGEHIVSSLERYILRHKGEQRKALELALVVWYEGPDLTRCVWAESLIVRLRLVQYLPELRRRRQDILSPDTRFPRYWLGPTERSIELLEQEAARRR